MFKNRTKKNIIGALKNKDHLVRESKLKIDLLYLFFFIPVFLFILNCFLIAPISRGQIVIPDRLIISFFFIAAAINLYRVSWTYQNSFRCFFTFLFFILGFIVIVESFCKSPFSTIPANAFLNFALNDNNPLGISYLDRYFEYLVNYNAIQQIVFDRLTLLLSILYTHLIFVFIIHYQIRRAQTMLYLHECKLEPEAIADYIIDPEKNSFLLEEALYRSNLNKNNRDQDRPKITMSESIYFKKDDEIDGNNKVYKKNNLVNPTTQEPIWDEEKLSPQDDKDYREDNNSDNKKKRFFNSTSSYFDSLRSEYEFDQNLEEDDSDEKKKD